MDLFYEFRRHPDIVQQPNSKGEATAWCPWHSDREGGTPSLGINVSKRKVKCWVCGKGGARNLAQVWGIELSDGPPPERQEIEQTYDYLNSDRTLRFQVVRFRVPPGAAKKILQRRPDPADPNAWIWNLKGVQPSLYRLPELIEAEPSEWVWIVEGEKDVDRLRDSGLIATCNPMGAGKWRKHYNRQLRGRKVAVVPDNDPAGIAHALNVATEAHTTADTVRLLTLPDVPEKGDVSDWMDAGHTVEELLALLNVALPFEPEPQETESEAESPDWRISPMMNDANKVTTRLNRHGFFVNGGADAFFFDRDNRQLVYLERDDRELRLLLGERYQINRQDQFYPYLVEHLLREAHIRGNHSLVRKFSYYDEDKNEVLLDMGAGRVLKIGVDSIRVRDNGEDGVLFLPMPEHEPWDYNPNAKWKLLFETVISRINFTEEGSEFTVQHQRTLLLLWMLSMAFECVMPTKVIAMAVGPGGAGKTSLFRTCGQILIGPDFDVDALLQDQKGEEDFWVNLSHSFLVAYDNVDQPIRWLPDALAQVATGVRRSRRQLHTTSNLYRSRISAMMAVTSRTPSYSLRREDVADRTLVFTLKRLHEVRTESEIQHEVRDRRNDLLSDYAKIVQRALLVPWDGVKVADPGMRMADFARVATRIGHGLGEEMRSLTDEVVSRIRLSQNRFATEEDVLTTLLRFWLTRHKPVVDGSMDLGSVANEGRPVTTAELLPELNAIAREFELRFQAGTPESLGRRIRNMEAALRQVFEIESDHGRKGTTWIFRFAPDTEDYEKF